ncbi:hypothetical protein F5880DRAFT_271949 [Lentinula raphanica]|nr:hypothetical protein F5880DRAFT_271949 [Lentinula raphanica]
MSLWNVRVSSLNVRVRVRSEREGVSLCIYSLAPLTTIHSPTLRPVRKVLPRDLSPSPNFPSIVVPDSRPTTPPIAPPRYSTPSTPTPLPKVKRMKLELEEPHEQLTMFDPTAPNSRHGKWPWKSFQHMYNGFVKLEDTGGKHTDVFPATTNKTCSLARAAWAAGSKELKQQFRANPSSTWGEYVSAVRAANGGSIPTYTSRKRQAQVEKKKVDVKSEEMEIICVDLD